jgi:microcin C transport system substrate-binding protein
MWHSENADMKSSSNITGFKNERVDELIEQTKEMFSVEERHEVIREIDRIIYEETPYVLLWNIDYVRLLYWNRFGMPEHMLGKYSDEWSAVDYWWADEFQSDDLKAAMEAGEELPAPPRDVYFDKVFTSGIVPATEPLQ